MIVEGFLPAFRGFSPEPNELTSDLASIGFLPLCRPGEFPIFVDSQSSSSQNALLLGLGLIPDALVLFYIFYSSPTDALERKTPGLTHAYLLVGLLAWEFFILEPIARGWYNRVY